jgi:putative FmdB family regulatory protein
MPLYEFECPACGERFEELVTGSECPPCPECGASEPVRVYSSISKPMKFGLRGADARRSNAVRRAREEQRREQRASRRERPSEG